MSGPAPDCYTEFELIAMLGKTPLSLALLCVLFSVASARATEYVDLGLHWRVQASNTVVLVRVVDPELAVVNVERVLKGEAPKQITLVAYIDGFAVPAQRRPLVTDARELLFLTKEGDAYAPVQNQYGRMAVNGDRLTDSLRAEPRRLSETVASIGRLVSLQTRAAQSDSEADQAYVAAFANRDVEVQKWALGSVYSRIKVPSPALIEAVLARWPKDAGFVANAAVTWRLRAAAPVVAKTLTTSGDGNERAFAAMALGGSGDLTYLALLRQVASSDAEGLARALAYNGIMYMLGPDSLSDLRRGARDSHELVRAHVVIDSYNLLELERQDRHWPPASSVLITEVRAFLTEMQGDPARLVSANAKSMLAMITRHRP
jgi:hypothetical protein